MCYFTLQAQLGEARQQYHQGIKVASYKLFMLKRVKSLIHHHHPQHLYNFLLEPCPLIQSSKSAWKKCKTARVGRLDNIYTTYEEALSMLHVTTLQNRLEIGFRKFTTMLINLDLSSYSTVWLRLDCHSFSKYVRTIYFSITSNNYV